MAAIVGVHGIGNYIAGVTPDEAAQRSATAWGEVLGRSLGRPADIAVAYYADCLRRGVAQGMDDPRFLPNDARQMLEAWLAQILDSPSGAQGAITVPLRILISRIADRYGLDHRLVERFVARFFGEVASYFDPGLRTTVKRRVLGALRAHQPRVVVAHSLGSVVAWEVLHSADAPPVELLLTVGSPLAIPGVILDKLVPASTESDRPPGVARWTNITDVGDIVSIPIRGVARRFGLHCDHSAIVGAFDFHRIAKYLAHPQVARHIIEPSGCDVFGDVVAVD
jgi:hypothetical protein